MFLEPLPYLGRGKQVVWRGCQQHQLECKFVAMIGKYLRLVNYSS